MVGFSLRGSHVTSACILLGVHKPLLSPHITYPVCYLHLQASNTDELQQLQSQLDSHKEAEQQLSARLAEAEAALKREEEQGQQAERQLGQMVEAQRRLGVELQEGVEAREEAEASRDQAQVLPVTFHSHGDPLPKLSKPLLSCDFPSSSLAFSSVKATLRAFLRSISLAYCASALHSLRLGVLPHPHSG